MILMSRGSAVNIGNKEIMLNYDEYAEDTKL